MSTIAFGGRFNPATRQGERVRRPLTPCDCYRQMDFVPVPDFVAKLVGICGFSIQVYLDKGLKRTVFVKYQFP